MKDFVDALRKLMAAHWTDARNSEMAKHLQAHATALATAPSQADAADQGHGYGPVFPDEADPNYGNPFGGATDD